MQADDPRPTLHELLKGRLSFNSRFPKVDIIIKNCWVFSRLFKMVIYVYFNVCARLYGEGDPTTPRRLPSFPRRQVELDPNLGLTLKLNPKALTINLNPKA